VSESDRGLATGKRRWVAARAEVTIRSTRLSGSHPRFPGAFFDKTVEPIGFIYHYFLKLGPGPN
jgi:hypothetical protein